MRKLYLDASFLACLFIPNHPQQAPAMTLFATFRVQKCKLYISPLVLDELWYAVYKEKINLGQVTAGIKDAFQDILQSWETIKNFDIFTLIQIKRPIRDGVERSLYFMDNFNLHPRDCFHLATANSQGINEVVVKDKDFVRADLTKSGNTVITY